MYQPGQPLLAVDDYEYGCGSALDQRGWHHPVPTLDAFGVSPLEAVTRLNADLILLGLPTYPLDGLDGITPLYMAESGRWRYVATHIL